MAEGALTTASGPAVVSLRSWQALAAIRRTELLAKVYGHVAVSEATAAAITAGDLALPDWLVVLADAPDQALPERLAAVGGDDAATLRCAVRHGASRVLIEDPVKEKAKLSFIKCEGVLAFLVHAHREGRLSAVEPMIKALTALGHADVLPDEAQLEALRAALRSMG